MPDAVIVSTARTPIGKAFRGAFNMTHGAVLGGHVVKHAVERAGVEPGEVEDVVMGCAMPERATGQNIARLSAIRAGLPVTVPGVTVNRFCSSGLQTIAFAAQRIIAGEADVIVAGGLESISLLQEGGRPPPVKEEWLEAHKPEIWMPMIETADIVAERYGVSRQAQDEYSLESQHRTAAAEPAIQDRSKPDEQGGEQRAHGAGDHQCMHHQRRRIVPSPGADGASDGGGDRAAHARVRHLLHQHQGRKDQRQASQRLEAELTDEIRIDAGCDRDQDDVDDKIGRGQSQQGGNDRPFEQQPRACRGRRCE